MGGGSPTACQIFTPCCSCAPEIASCVGSLPARLYSGVDTTVKADGGLAGGMASFPDRMRVMWVTRAAW